MPEGASYEFNPLSFLGNNVMRTGPNKMDTAGCIMATAVICILLLITLYIASSRSVLVFIKYM